MAAGEALRLLAARLREEGAEVAQWVEEPAAVPALGLLGAAGPRAAAAPAEYALVVEAVREGYLLHYGAALGVAPRIVRDGDPDLTLLAGDYLYALGLDRLAALGDSEAVLELGDLISLSAQVHAGLPASASPDGAAGATALWLAAVTAVTAGSTPEHERAKAALRAVRSGAPDDLLRAAADTAGEAAISAQLADAAEALAQGSDAIHFVSLDPPRLG